MGDLKPSGPFLFVLGGVAFVAGLFIGGIMTKADPERIYTSLPPKIEYVYLPSVCPEPVPPPRNRKTIDCIMVGHTMMTCIED